MTEQFRQLQIAQILVLEDPLLHFSLLKDSLFDAKQDIFHLGYVLPSNVGFASDGKSLIESRKSSDIIDQNLLVALCWKHLSLC